MSCWLPSPESLTHLLSTLRILDASQLPMAGEPFDNQPKANSVEPVAKSAAFDLKDMGRRVECEFRIICRMKDALKF